MILIMPTFKFFVREKCGYFEMERWFWCRLCCRPSEERTFQRCEWDNIWELIFPFFLYIYKDFFPLWLITWEGDSVAHQKEYWFWNQGTWIRITPLICIVACAALGRLLLPWVLYIVKWWWSRRSFLALNLWSWV